MDVFVKHPAVTLANVDQIVGMIPSWLSELDPRSASEQLDSWYQHGGGWSPFKGHKLNDDNSLSYPGDPDLPVLVEMTLRDETICIYPHAWVAIIQKDRSFEVCRMD